ncbi:MAG: acetyl-CoA carboxylase biotin carboxyl carrier protein subunit [Bacteroidales bacterium]|nr:acetyl-CoA carboxylase biotin carboxyl carrier protein subunit [Bacteroidales bacterium]
MSKPAKSVKKLPIEPPLERLQIGSVRYATRLTKKFVNRKSWQRPDNRKLPAVIPGTIQKIMVKEGDEVILGTPLLILEAMKMRNEVLSPMDGVILKIHVSEGDLVPRNHLLLEFK